MFVFIVTSAIQTKFGVFDDHARLAQTLETLESIRSYAPDSRIIILECSAAPVSDRIIDALKTQCDQIILFKEGSFETNVANTTNNHDVAKNFTEVRCFERAMRLIDFKQLRIEGYQRVFKISGRYRLTSEFDAEVYSQPYVRDRICIKHRMPSQFMPDFTNGLQFQYMCRLWSFPTHMASEIASMYKAIHDKMSELLAHGCYMDIEHGLYLFLGKETLFELQKVGVTGLLGPNGTQVLD